MPSEDKPSNAPGGAPATPDFSHLDEAGEARMVDVSSKGVSCRVAGASCRVLLSPSTVKALRDLPKGDAVTTARIAGIQGAKRAAELIPMAHPLILDAIGVEVETLAGDDGESGVEITSRVVVHGRTGAEMEALTACATAALALYDMVKAVERGAVITDLRLETKSGGKSGPWKRGSAAARGPEAGA